MGTCRKNQRDTLLEKCLASIEFLRDDYVLDIFSENIQYIKWALKVLLPKRIAIEKSSSNTPYIVLSTLSDLRLPIPNKSNQCHIAKLMQSLERKLSSQIALNGSYNKLKQYLLRQMFI